MSNKLAFDLLTLKVVSESHVTWTTSVPILVFLGLSVLDLGPMYATDVRQTDVRQHHRLMPPPYGGGGIIILIWYSTTSDLKHCCLGVEYFPFNALTLLVVGLQNGHPA